MSSNIVVAQSTYYCNTYYFTAEKYACEDCGGSYTTVVVAVQNWYPLSTTGYYLSTTGVNTSIYKFTSLTETAGPGETSLGSTKYITCKSSMIAQGCWELS